MIRVFNVTGRCRPEKHYMVNLKSRIESIRQMIDEGEYFMINRPRQYGKTTLLYALADLLKENYVVVHLDFQTMCELSLQSEENFVAAFAAGLLDNVSTFPEKVQEWLLAFVEGTAGNISLNELFRVIEFWCGYVTKPIVLLIGEVDTATNNQVFIDFLAQLRAYYLNRPEVSAFHSVILTGVYDIRNIRRKIRPDEVNVSAFSMKSIRRNSPWNTHESNEENASSLAFDDCPWDQMELATFDIAADFNIDMSFSAIEIQRMLTEYESDYHTGMDTAQMANLIYDYTSGYPYLVSRLCKILDEQIAGSEAFPDKAQAWTSEGFLAAEKLLVNDSNALFLSLKGKLNDYPKLKKVMYDLLFTGKPIPYTPMNDYIEIAAIFGFIRNENGFVVIFNRIFETVLYNWFMSEKLMNFIFDKNREIEMKEAVLGDRVIVEAVV